LGRPIGLSFSEAEEVAARVDLVKGLPKYNASLEVGDEAVGDLGLGVAAQFGAADPDRRGGHGRDLRSSSRLQCVATVCRSAAAARTGVALPSSLGGLSDRQA
jgi:hypothetical protein